MGTSTFWRKCNEALCDTFSLLGFHFDRVLVEKCRVAGDVSSLVRYLKTWVAIWLPLVLGDDLPPGTPTDPYEILDGPFKTFWRNRMTGKGTHRRLRLATLVLNSKRLFPALPISVVEEKLNEYYAGLQRPVPSMYPYRREVTQAIRDGVDEIGDMVADYTRPFAPSSSACLENSRMFGGLQSFVRDLLHKDLAPNFPFIQKIDLLVNKMSDEELILTNWPSIWRTILEYLLEKADMQMFLDSGLGNGMGDIGDLTNFIEDSESRGVPLASYSGSWSRMPAVTTGIPEPLKVRLVTKQTWLLQLLSPIQKAWHDQMRKHPVYQLIGGVPVSSAISGMRLERGQKFVSGDYEAATDNIHLWCTKVAAEAMLERTRFILPEGLEKFEVLLRKLAVHSLISTSVLNKGKSLDVTRGQMMGHILSFPLLCLINRSVSVMAVPRDRFMRVNGDDILFPASDREYACWKRTTSYAGLKFSLGKNYFSRDMALVNSEFYIWSKDRNCLTRMLTPNLGLLKYHKEMIDRDTGRQVLPWEQYGSLWVAFEATVDPKYWNAAYRLFRKRYPMLHRFPGPLFGPRELGALGGRVPEGWEFTRMERMWMEAHRQGKFDFREGIHSDYSRVQDRFFEIIRKENPELSFGVPEGRLIGPSPDVVPDPYARGGGLAERVMVLRRWVQGTVSEKKCEIFGQRRWRRFLQRHTGGVGLLSGHSLESVCSNAWSSHRRRWFLVRHHQREYEEDASFYHLIFPGQ